MTGSSELMLRLWPVPSACSDARHAVREFCLSRSLGGLADDAELLTSEVVTNAIQHATSLITVLVAEHDASVVVSVRDDGEPGGQLRPASPSATDERGRGIFLMDSIAGDWGTTAQDNGKAVWFRLP